MHAPLRRYVEFLHMPQVKGPSQRWQKFSRFVQGTSVVVVVLVVLVVVEGVVNTGPLHTSQYSHWRPSSVVKHHGRGSPSGLRQYAPSLRPELGKFSGVSECECGSCEFHAWHANPPVVYPLNPR